MNLKRQDGIVYGSLSLEDRKTVGYSGSDDADLINVSRPSMGSRLG